MKAARIVIIFFTTISSAAFSYDEGKFGLNEEATVQARKTLMNARSMIDDAIRMVEGVIYPNLMTYGVDTRVNVTDSNILMNFTSSTTDAGTLGQNIISSEFAGSYTRNPYVKQLVILESGLRVQFKFASFDDQPEEPFKQYKIPLFEPFLGKRIIIAPILNIKYDNNGKIVVRNQEIDGWECLTDGDSGVVASGATIAEGMRSIVAMGGGILGTCQYISPINLDTLWKNIP